MKSINLIFIALLITAAALAETPVSGTVDGKWTKEGSPYRVTGDLIVARGSTLWIEPDVEVVFDGLYSLTVEGRLVAGRKKGLRLRSEDQPPVRFTTDLDRNPAGWGGIRLVKAGDDNEFVNCTVEHVRATSNGNAVRCERSKVVLTNCTFSDCATDGAGGGVAVLNGSAVLVNATIEGCRAEEQGGGIYGVDAEVALVNCSIRNNIGAAGGAVFMSKSEFVSTNDNYENNTNGGVALLDKSEGVFINSTLRGSGIVCRESELVITNGSIESGDETALSCSEHSEVVVTNATLKGGKGLLRDETSEVMTMNTEH